MARRVFIEDETNPELRGQRAAATDDRPRVDLQDFLLIGGIGFLEVSAWVIWWPSALILAGLFCFGFAYLIERDGTTEPKTRIPGD
jgi:hypothetical protein